MGRMTQVVNAVVRALSVYGLRTIAAFSGQQLPILAEPLAAVGIESRSTKASLHGVSYTQQTVFVDLYASYRSGAQSCEEAAQIVERALLAGITDFSVLSVGRGELRHDAPSDCYRLRLRAELVSYDEEEDE